MRLSSLARKIKTTPTHLSAFLTGQGISLPQGVNTKLEEASIELALSHYKATLIEEVEEEIVTEKIEIIEEEVISIQSEDIVVEEALLTIEPDTIESIETEDSSLEESESKEEELSSPELVNEEIDSNAIIEPESDEIAPVEAIEESDIDSEKSIDLSDTVIQEEKEDITVQVESKTEEEVIEPEVEAIIPEEIKDYQPIETEDGVLIESLAELAALDESVDIIKAQKAQPLQGLTIKGKIDLPEPKLPQEKPEKKETPSLDPNQIIYTSGPQHERKKRREKTNKRPPRKKINRVEADRRRLEKEEKRKKDYKEKKEKEAKTAHYTRKITSPKPQTPTKKKVKKKIAEQEQKFEGNAVQKFWKWLNT